jgi:hypothetical protein
MKCSNCGIGREIKDKCDYCHKPLGKTIICYHAPLIFSKPDGDHATHFDKRSCLKEFCLDLAGYYDYEINAITAKSKPSVIIIDNNPLSLAAYMQEHPRVLDDEGDLPEGQTQV